MCVCASLSPSVGGNYGGAGSASRELSKRESGAVKCELDDGNVNMLICPTFICAIMGKRFGRTAPRRNFQTFCQVHLRK